jgi:hypothetical protein
MAPENILRLIPGDLILIGGENTTGRKYAHGTFREVVIDVPGHFKARIRFERFRSKRGRMGR